MLSPELQNRCVVAQKASVPLSIERIQFDSEGLKRAGSGVNRSHLNELCFPFTFQIRLNNKKFPPHIQLYLPDAQTKDINVTANSSLIHCPRGRRTKKKKKQKNKILKSWQRSNSQNCCLVFHAKSWHCGCYYKKGENKWQRALFGNEYNTGPWVNVKSLPSIDSIIQRQHIQ